MTVSTDTQSIHKLTIGVLLQGLRNMSGIMAKAKAEAPARGLKAEVLLDNRLFPDMFNLLQQVQYVCYLSVDFARHFTSEPPPRVGYDEASWEELRNSLEVTAAYLGSIKPDTVASRANALVPTFMDDSKGMKAIDYAASVIVPDFHFHMVVAYGLLRNSGIGLGKSDFLGPVASVKMPPGNG